MKKDKVEPIECKEFFELKLNVPNSQVPIAELIEYLKNTDKLFKGVNQTLNEKYAIGFNSIAIEVVPFEEGSFRIPVWIKKIAKNPYFAGIVITVLGEIIADLLRNELGVHEIQTENEVVVVEDKKILENKTTADALSNIASLAINNDSIRDITVTYDKSNGERERINVSKEVLHDVAEYGIEDEPTRYLQTNVTLEIVSPVFSEEPTNWKVRYNNKAFTAKMKDADFLEVMNAKGIAFGKGDTILADFETVLTDIAGGGRPKFNIIKVHSYPRYTKITRGRVSELDLFE